MNEEEQRFRTSDHTPEEASEMAMLANIIREATTEYVTACPDHRHAMAMLMAALPMYAGHLFSILMITGEVEQKHQARMAKSVSHNFREGVKVGLKMNLRNAKESGIVGSVQ